MGSKLPTLCAALLLTLTACSSAAPAEVTPSPAFSPAPSEQAQFGVLSSFSATDLEGNPVDQSILSGCDLTMVNVWGTFCPPCKEEMPYLAELHEEYAGRGFQIVGLVSDVLNQDGSINQDQVASAREIAQATGADYLHLLPSEDLFFLLSQVYALPSTFFVDSEGNQIGSLHLGMKTKEQWAALIEEMLEEVS
ncbi:TlpA family protein disulfide reductase [Pseudoflavonifractor sp. 524-17]|uniref:TlpA family protein disulfide reductase n=1 Tax=Pseudoflavonifractor sp. 524-17 TaxID=2304577 RepID=UPI00137B40DC|nr:TlpA disulfide reductase family protein [Pseudoflavonifractor sp. 524-17]NCE64342.1 TlpA family protein disulfide reductase [Pseudoflavonifractor sp. 524-17]